jgi:hypothetical protein
LSRERADEMVPLGLARFCSKPRVMLTVVHLALGSIVPKDLPWRVEYLWYAVVKMSHRMLRETVGTRCKEFNGTIPRTGSPAAGIAGMFPAHDKHVDQKA